MKALAEALTNILVPLGVIVLLASLKKKSLQPIATFAFRLIVGGVLVTAGYLKAGHTAEARMAVQAYKLLPNGLAANLGYALPWIEIGVGILILLGAFIKYSGLFAALLMAVFVIAIGQAWARGLSIDCGCFGGGGKVAAGQTRYLQEIARDSGLMALGIYLFRNPRGILGLDK
jgi:uncharacterized membrane protein YphA (DoxX/SURF4 family)